MHPLLPQKIELLTGQINKAKERLAFLELKLQNLKDKAASQIDMESLQLDQSNLVLGLDYLEPSLKIATKSIKRNAILSELNLLNTLHPKAIVDEQFWPYVRQFSWAFLPGSYNSFKNGSKYVAYAVTTRYVQPKKSTQYYLHRIIWELANGPIPKGMQIDHINGDGLDNRLQNLRLATRNQNMANRTSQSLSGYKGVYKSPKKILAKPWVATIRCDGKTRYLGYFSSAIEAAQAYDAAALEIFGSFAKLNFPLGTST